MKIESKEDSDKDQVVRKTVNDVSGKKAPRTGRKITSSLIKPLEDIKKIVKKINPETDNKDKQTSTKKPKGWNKSLKYLGFLEKA